MAAKQSKGDSPIPWWEDIGVFANDPVYDKAMKLGRAYRRSLRPKKQSVSPPKRHASADTKRHASPSKRLAK